MKMSPIKKIVIGLAVVTVALSLITANNMASVMLIVASRDAGSATQQSVQTNAPVQNQTNNTQSGISSNDTAVDNTATDNTATTAAADNTASDNTASDNTASDNTASDNTASDNTASDNKAPNNAASDNKATDNKATDNKGSADKKTTGKPESKAEIVTYFNKAVNGVKSGAKSVDQKYVTNYLAGTTTISSGIKSIYNMLGGDDWLDATLQDNSQGEASYTGDDIVAKFPVEGETWSSKLTESDVSSATCTEKDGVYTITIATIADAKSENVKRGEGHAPKAFNVILPGVVNDNIPSIATSLVGTAAMEYPSSTVKITVDAKTGHVITADYDLKWTINFDKMGIILPFGTKAAYTVNW